MSVTERVPLADVRDLIAVGQALPFRVLDTQKRLLLNEGQAVGSERPFEMLTERGAWGERSLVERVRAEQSDAIGPATHLEAKRQATLFDLWDQALWDLDELQAQMAEQGEPPTGKQIEQIRAHPQGAVRVLQQAGVTEYAVVTALAEAPGLPKILPERVYGMMRL